jgi:voltage-gated potassium channel
MNPSRRILQIVCALIVVVAIGIVGYMTIEEWSLLDSLYMTITTLSTVGYKEVHELSFSGRIFTIVLIIGGVGIMFYGLTTMVQYVIEGNIANILRRRPVKEKITKLKDHIIVCGYGRVGREVARVFESEGSPFIIIDPDLQAINKAANDGYLYVQGNATNDDILKEAGIERARALVAAAGDDADNVFITLSARGLRPDIFITARVDALEAETKLKRAGADRTIYPHVLGGRRLALLALRPLVIDFVDTALHSRGKELVLEDIKIGKGSPVLGEIIREGHRCGSGAIILALKKKGEKLITDFSNAVPIEIGDEVVVVGTREQLQTLEG